MSTATFFSMSAWSTLTTTGSPEWSRARWTCPIEAEAIASGSNSANSSSIGRPNSASTSFRTTWGGSAGTLAWSCWNSSASRTPTRSGRVLSIWPNLMNVGPSSARAIRRRVSQGSRAMAAPPRAFNRSLAKSGPSRPIHAASSYLLSTARISYQRPKWR